MQAESNRASNGQRGKKLDSGEADGKALGFQEGEVGEENSTFFADALVSHRGTAKKKVYTEGGCIED